MKLSIKLFIPIIIIIHTIVWYITYHFLAINDIYGFYTGFLDFIISKQGEFYATLLMTLLSFNILLAARFKFLENIFSGLDKVYVAHKYSAYFIFIFIILHDTFIHGSRSHTAGFFSLSKEVANPLMWLFFISIFLSALPYIPFVKKIFNIPYNVWKYTHYLMGILFLVGIYHSVGVNTLTFSNTTLSIYMYIVYSIGVLALLYKSFFYNIFKKQYKYNISNIKKYQNDTLIEINFSPENENNILKHKAGQFAFFKFEQNGLEEIHPFTISNIENEKGEIRLSIKNLGDWTQKLITELKEDTKVKIDGPYGKFTSKKEKDNLEIWIAGGIGITPFLAMLEDYKKENNINKQIIFVWTVRDEYEAIYKEEIERDLPNNINFILHSTSQSGFFKFENLLSLINNKDNTYIYICGPAPMREAIINDAKKENFSDFNFEEFSFR